MPSPRKPLSEAAIKEAENLRRLLEFVRSAAVESFERKSFELTPSLILELHRLTLEGQSPEAGRLRNGRMFIVHSEHEPPPADSVTALLDQMCAYANERLSLEFEVLEDSDRAWRGGRLDVSSLERLLTWNVSWSLLSGEALRELEC